MNAMNTAKAIKILLIESNFFNALNIKKSIIEKYPNLHESNILWVNSIESANLMLGNHENVFETIVINGKPANIKTLEKLGLSSMIQKATAKQMESGSRSQEFQDVSSCAENKRPESSQLTVQSIGFPSGVSVPIASPNSHNCVPLSREFDKLEFQLTELKTYVHRTSDNLFDEVEKIEGLLFNTTGGGLMSRVEKLSFSVGELDEKVEELSKSFRQLEDFKYNVSGMINSLKEKQDTSFFQRTKAQELFWLFVSSCSVAVLTFILGQISIPQPKTHHQQNQATPTVQESKHSAGIKESLGQIDRSKNKDKNLFEWQYLS